MQIVRSYKKVFLLFFLYFWFGSPFLNVNVDEVYEIYKKHFNFTDIIISSPSSPSLLREASVTLPAVNNKSAHPHHNKNQTHKTIPKYKPIDSYDPESYSLRIHTKPFPLPQQIQSACEEKLHNESSRFYREMSALVHSRWRRTVLYIYCHDETSLRQAIQESICYDWMFPLPLQLHRFCESQVYKYVFPLLVEYWVLHKVKHIVVTTYKYMDISNDQSFNLEHYHHQLKIMYSQNFDFLPLWRGNNSRWLKMARLYHGREFTNTWNTLTSVMGYPNFTENDEVVRHPPFYKNAFIAKLPVLLDLMQFMINATNLIETNENVIRLIESNAKYNSTMNSEQLQEAFHANYYKLYPFIMERLPIVYIYYRKYKICDFRNPLCHSSLTTV